MGLLEIIGIAVGLAMDAVAVSITNGMCMKKVKAKDAFLIAFSFGVFQGLMPLFGYYAGFAFAQKMQSVDHWIALFLLGCIGLKMIYSAIKQNNRVISIWRFTLRLLLIQSIATSIDAFMVGMSFATFSVSIVPACLIIAAVTFLFSEIAVYIGSCFGAFFKNKAEFIGGWILLIIAFKIFLSHYF